MNKYLEKIAKADWNSIGKFIGNVTGKRAKDHAVYVKNVHDWIANNRDLNWMHGKTKNLAAEKIRDRVRAGIGGAAVVGTAGYGVHKIREKQRQETARQYEQFFKSASTTRAGLDFAKGILKGTLNIGGGLARKTLNTISTANGGRLMDYAKSTHGLERGSHGYDTVYNAKTFEEKVKAFKTHGRKMPPGHLARDIHNLTNQQNHARVAIGSTAVAGVAGYAAMKRKKDEPNYYN